MKFLIWMLGVFVLLLALEYSRGTSSAWSAVWISALVFWLLTGLGLAIGHVAKLVAGKLGAGALSGLSQRRPPAPAPHKEE